MSALPYLLLGAALVALAIWSALRRRSLIGHMLALEVGLGGVLLTSAALWHFAAPRPEGLLLALLVLTLMALQLTLGLAILVALHRQRREAQPGESS